MNKIVTSDWLIADFGMQIAEYNKVKRE